MAFLCQYVCMYYVLLLLCNNNYFGELQRKFMTIERIQDNERLIMVLANNAPLSTTFLCLLLKTSPCAVQQATVCPTYTTNSIIEVSTCTIFVPS